MVISRSASVKVSPLLKYTSSPCWISLPNSELALPMVCHGPSVPAQPWAYWREHSCAISFCSKDEHDTATTRSRPAAF